MTFASHEPAASTSRTRRFFAAVAPRVVRGITAAVVTCLPVAVLAGVVRQEWGPLVPADAQAIVAATDITRARPALLHALVTWQEALLPWRVHLATLPFVLYAAWRGLRGRALWAAATILVGWNVGLDVKLIVRRARPVVTDPVATAPGYSFPSGHVFNVTLAFVTVAVLLWPFVQGHLARAGSNGGPSRRVTLRRPRALTYAAFVVLGIATVVATALDRVFLGVHYPSDTVAGALLACGFVAASWIGFGHTSPRRRRATDLGSRPEETR